MEKMFSAHTTSRIASVLFAIMTLVLAGLHEAAAFPISWSLVEFQPNVKNGGRADTIAVNPTNNAIMFVASESGGLFSTSDSGVTWHHVDSFVLYYTAAIVYVPANPNILIATASDSFSATNEGGGIWRSTDSGASWTHVANPPAPPGVTTRFAAGEISIAPDTGKIYVSTAFGISISSDQGATWTPSTPFGSNGAYSVVAQKGNLIVAGNASGVVRSTDGGMSWAPATTGPGAIVDLHAFARSPFAANTLYAVNNTTKLFVSEDSGDTWTNIASAPPGGGGCGGITFVKPILSSLILPHAPRHMTLWFGNRCGLSRLPATQISGTTRFGYGGTWTASTLDHGDTRDLAFSTGLSAAPILLGTDGGLHRTADNGASWTFTGGGTGGYNALQITEVKGQWIDNISRFDLYFGTQDNNNLSSGDMGGTWPHVICCEGFFFEMQNHVAAETDSEVNFTSCGPCSNLHSGALFAGLTGWTNPAGTVVGNPTIIAKSLHDQGVNSEGGFTKGMAVTQDLGMNWTQYATFPEDRRDIPKLSQHTVIVPPKHLHVKLPVQYQPIRTGYDFTNNLDIVHLVRLSKASGSATASVYYPAMNGFGGLGINPTMFAWYEVFAVDPLDSSHLIAPDIINQKMMETHDGGNNWTENASLTSLVTEAGHYMFRNWVFPHASAVDFYADNPNMVAMGTQQGGLLLSSDRGTTWSKVPDSEKATYITSIEWDSSTDAFVSTYGRGLWRLTGTAMIPHFPPLCAIIPCLLKYIDMGDPAPDRFQQGVVVFDGQILGARAEAGIVKELFVSPGSSIGIVGDRKGSNITITQTARTMGFEGFAKSSIDLSSKGPALVGMALDKKGAFFGAFLQQAEHIVQPSTADQGHNDPVR